MRNVIRAEATDQLSKKKSLRNELYFGGQLTVSRAGSVLLHFWKNLEQAQLKRRLAAIRRGEEEEFECSEAFWVLFQPEETRSALSYRHKKPKNSSGREGRSNGFPKCWEGQGMAALCQQQQRFLVAWGAENFFPSLYWLQWNYLLPARAEEFHLSIGKSCLWVGLVSLSAFVCQLPLPLWQSLFGSCFATHHPKSTSAGKREKLHFLFSFFLHFSFL